MEEISRGRPFKGLNGSLPGPEAAHEEGQQALEDHPQDPRQDLRREAPRKHGGAGQRSAAPMGLSPMEAVQSLASATP
jgi:hypothetical protein